MARVLSDRAQITPTLDTSAYAANDQVSTIQTATFHFPVWNTLLTQVVVVDKAAQKSALDLFFFTDSVTLAADQAAASISDADMAAYSIGVVNILAADYDDTAANSVATVVPNLRLRGSNPKTGDIYVAVVSRGTPTYAATSLVISLTATRE